MSVTITTPEVVANGDTEPQPLPAPQLTEAVVPDELKDPETGKYLGDVQDNSAPLADNGQWECFNFESPLELIYTFDRHLNSGKVALYAWQVEQLESFAKEKPTSKQPHRFALCAANGSGKDAYVIAPFVIWFALCKIRSLTIITSSSGVQLTAQTERYIADLAREVNAKFGQPIFKITRRFIKCLKSGSEIRMFATDEAGKAEGYHPLEPDSEMLIVVNEAKSVTPEIFGALSRCTGYNYWVNVSTPGEPYGDFYDSFTNWPHKRRITAYDCDHLLGNHIDELKRKFGEHSAIFRSQVLALFTAVGGMCVVSQDFLNKCIELSKLDSIKTVVFGRKRLGIDLGAGRDENAFVCSLGNKVVDEVFFVERDTTITEVELEKFIEKHGGHLGANCDVYADDGGVGHAIIDRLVKKGYNITRVLNQSRALDHTQFGNRGAEMWFKFARLVEEAVLVLPLNVAGNPSHRKLYEQLAFRHYKKNETSGRVTLESKEEARANGHVSPDRADAYVLSFCGTDITEIDKELAKLKPPPRPVGKTIEQLMLERIEAHRKMYLGATAKVEPITNNSIESLMALKNN